MTSSPNREIGSEMVGAMHQSSGSFELVGGAVLAAVVGFGLDTVFGIRPLLTVVFGILGLAGAAVGLFYGYRADMASATATRSRRVRGGSDS